ncbi:MAG: triose-phosphate isomerase, partial [Pseudomonadota bacterium]
MRKYLVAGNWKMNGSTAANQALLDGVLAGHAPSGQVDVLVCPPSVYLESIGKAVAGSGIALGAQTVSEHNSGAFTGEVSAAMLLDQGCSYVIVGHSERRAMYGETSEQVAAKFAAAQAAGLTPVLCVGESQSQREAGETSTVVDE